MWRFSLIFTGFQNQFNLDSMQQFVRLTQWIRQEFIAGSVYGMEIRKRHWKRIIQFSDFAKNGSLLYETPIFYLLALNTKPHNLCFCGLIHFIWLITIHASKVFCCCVMCRRRRGLKIVCCIQFVCGCHRALYKSIICGVLRRKMMIMLIWEKRASSFVSVSAGCKPHC